jgi:hypothetical protein
MIDTIAAIMAACCIAMRYLMLVVLAYEIQLILWIR